jgi:eukaryotic-like serine/threonine-protein kinase
VRCTLDLKGPGLGTSLQFGAGSHIGKYRIEGPLGAGGMGVVYAASDQILGRTVALKFLPSPLAGDVARDRFLREAIAASSLDHPNIGAVFGLEEFEGQPFIAMAYYPGGSLRERMSRGPLAVPEALRIASEIASGLAAAHAKGIVHRDIKPSNILFSESGGVKIVDFGLAKLETAPELTAPGTTVGTVVYMAPEQSYGSEVGPAGDTWALGVVLYEMLSGRRPFDGNSYAAILRAVLHDEPQPLVAVPAVVGGIVRRALNKAPQGRYRSAAQFHADLELARGSAAPADETVTLTAATATRGEKRGRTAWLLAGLILLAALGALAWRELPLFKHAPRQVAILPLNGRGRIDTDDRLSGRDSF